MIMDEGQEGSRFVCKLCNKKCTSGKSLGGHMRSHAVSIPSGKYASPEFVDGGQSGYVLRENPKKTWRAEGAKVDRVCKQCGKGFHSLKALCGHMACHSDRDRGLKDDHDHDHDHSWTREKPNIVMDSHSDTEAAEERRMGIIRSSKRFKEVVDNEYSSVSEIDGLEDVEVAVCLMLLSMDCGNKCGVVRSFVESSDNSSVVLETKSSSMEGLNHIHIQDKTKKIAPMEDSDSGYFLDECGKAESDVSVDVFRECKKPVMIKNLSAHLGKMSNRNEHAGTESRKRKFSGSKNPSTWNESGSMTGKSTYGCFNGKRALKSYKRSKEVHESRHETGENNPENSTNNTTAVRVVKSSKKQKPNGGNSSEKKTKLNKNEGGHICPFCNKVFKNGQALGGHKRSHFVVVRHEGNNNPRPIVKHKLAALLDLNLPAPEVDDDQLNQFVS